MFQSSIQAGLASINYQDSCLTLDFVPCLASAHDLLLSTTKITILIMGFNSHWNSGNTWLTIANYQDNKSHRGLKFCAQCVHTSTTIPIFVMAYFKSTSCSLIVVTIQIGYLNSRKMFLFKNLQHCKVSQGLM